MNLLPPQDLTPPNPSGWHLGATIACGAHLLLILALAWGVNWSSSQPVGVEAELWSAVPQIAAPRPTAPPPPPEPVKPPPKPQPAPPPPPKPQELQNAQIAIEKAIKEEQKKKDAEQERKLADKEKRERELAREAAKKEEERKTKVQQEKAEAARQQMLKRILDQAQGPGDPDAQGTATQTSGPSANYAGRIRAKIRPNIVFNTDTIAGNPEADVEVRLSPDGRIQSQRLIASSGFKDWDEAVLRAIERTERLPLDDGRVPAVMVLTFRPRD